MKRRKKRSDPFTEIAEEMIALGIISSIAEQLREGVHCISDGELELWLVGTGPPGSVESEDAQLFTIANDTEFGVKSGKNGVSRELPMQEVVTHMPGFKASGINRGHLRLTTSQGSNRTTKSPLGRSKVKKSPRRST